MRDYEAIDWDEKDCERMIAAQDLSRVLEMMATRWMIGDEIH